MLESPIARFESESETAGRDKTPADARPAPPTGSVKSRLYCTGAQHMARSWEKPLRDEPVSMILPEFLKLGRVSSFARPNPSQADRGPLNFSGGARLVLQSERPVPEEFVPLGQVVNLDRPSDAENGDRQDRAVCEPNCASQSQVGRQRCSDRIGGVSKGAHFRRQAERAHNQPAKPRVGLTYSRQNTRKTVS